MTIEPEPRAVEAQDAASPFEEARDDLRRLAREEDWRGVAAVLARLPKLATSHAEYALAAQDLGVFHRSQGAREKAAEAFDEALAYARLTTPADTALLAGALTDAGDMALEDGRSETATALYVELVELRRQHAAEDPSNDNRRLLSLALERLGDAFEDRARRTRALQLYQESLSIAAALAAADPGRYGAELATTRERVAELEARLA